MNFKSKQLFYALLYIYLCGISQNQQINEQVRSSSSLFFDIYVLQRNVTSRVKYGNTTCTRAKI